MVTGSSFQTFSSDHARKVICSLVAEDKRENLSYILIGLCSVVKIINSQKRRLNTDRMRDLSTSILLRIVEKFPWAMISPSVHRILAHGWERVSMDGGYGLGSESEEGLEALNKWIRRLREKGARKTDTLANFTDTFNHLWDRSRPQIVEMKRKIKKRKPKLVIETEIEAAVGSLFDEDCE